MDSWQLPACMHLPLQSDFGSCKGTHQHLRQPTRALVTLKVVAGQPSDHSMGLLTQARRRAREACQAALDSDWARLQVLILS